MSRKPLLAASPPASSPRAAPSPPPPRPARPRRPPPQRAAAPSGPAELPPLPAKRTPTVVEPVAGGAGVEAEVVAAAEPARPARRRSRRATRDDLELSRPSTAGDGVHDATALPNGIALPPLEAPDAVRQIIEAGNVIARSPYKWGGGHGRWVDTGYDCSGLRLLRARRRRAARRAAGLRAR